MVVMNMYGILNHLVSNIIGFTVNNTAFNSGTCHPAGESVGMMGSTLRAFTILSPRCPAKFGTKDQKDLIEESSLF